MAEDNKTPDPTPKEERKLQEEAATNARKGTTVTEGGESGVRDGGEVTRAVAAKEPIPDPNVHTDKVRDADDAGSGQAAVSAKVNAESDEGENPALMGYQVTHFDGTSPIGALSAMAYPSKAAVRAAKVSSPRNTLRRERGEDVILDDEEEKKEVEAKRASTSRRTSTRRSSARKTDEKK